MSDRDKAIQIASLLDSLDETERERDEAIRLLEEMYHPLGHLMITAEWQERRAKLLGRRTRLLRCANCAAKAPAPPAHKAAPPPR
jgi:hypothetical protein